ncbi:MAG: DUF2225 domain-containing protein [Defluviitaleaceae bacterium]|nr:DUF2225 domain-containing protein [Defluviitaleaceae bacterium]
MSGNIFAGMEGFGLSSVAENKLELFKSTVKEQKSTQNKETREFCVDDYIYEKKFTCPVCHIPFTSNVARDSKIKVQSIDFDLRPICTPIDPIYYYIVVCDSCGYSAANSTFSKLTQRQAELILAEITPKFRPSPYPKQPDTDMAIARYKLALLNAMVKQAKDGEKAYLCMKITWLYRIKGNEVDNEKMFAKLTLDGFTNALSSENTPIMGLEESTIMCLIGAFSMFLGDNEYAMKVLSDLIVSKKSSERLKDRARDLKNEIITARLIASNAAAQK